MPLILASILRTLVMALVTGSTIAAIQSFFSDAMKNIVDGIRNGVGISEQDAKDLVVNFLIDTAENTGVTFVLLKARLPVKVADYLGISGSTVAKKTLTPAATKAVVALKSSASTSIFSTTIAKIVGIASIPASLIWLVNALANTIEPGIYKPEQTNAVYRKLGIPFQYPMSAGSLQPGPFDGPGFSEYARALETQGIFSVSSPCALADIVYSRQVLADLVDCVYGQQVSSGVAPSKTKLIPMLAPYIRTRTSPVASGAAAPSASAPSVGVAISTPSIKVFTGIVSQGVLGAGLTFTARPNDLIESADDLQQAASNNLAATLAALPASLSYEIKIVSSVVTKDGFRQTGSSQQIITGYNKNGTPKYRTVVNRFATLAISLTNDKGTRTKIRTIVLGPTNVLKFNPNAGQITGIETLVKNNIITSDTSAIQTVVSSAPIVSVAVPPPTPAPVPVPAVPAPAASTSGTVGTPTQKAVAVSNVVSAFSSPTNTAAQNAAIAAVAKAFAS